MPQPIPNRAHFSDEDLRRIIAKQLPAWKRACAASDASAIVLHESAFGRSHSELLLLACAIKYAALSNKNIHIVCGESGRRANSRPRPRIDASVRTYHEHKRTATGGPSRRKKACRNR